MDGVSCLGNGCGAGTCGVEFTEVRRGAALVVVAMRGAALVARASGACAEPARAGAALYGRAPGMEMKDNRLLLFNTTRYGQLGERYAAVEWTL